MHLVIVGGSDAGIAAALRARELDPDVEVSVLVADRYPNYSICGLPYLLSGEVSDWRSLAHRTRADLEAAGIELLLDHRANAIDPTHKRIEHRAESGTAGAITYDRLIIASGATPVRPTLPGIDAPGVHLLHTMGDAFALQHALRSARRAVIVGAGYIGLEMAEALTRRDIAVTVVEQLGHVLPTVDPPLGALIEGHLTDPASACSPTPP